MPAFGRLLGIALLCTCACAGAEPGDEGESSSGQATSGVGTTGPEQASSGDASTGAESQGSDDTTWGATETGTAESSGDTGDGADPGEWQLPESHRVGPILDIYPLYPRPDTETSSTAYHRVAHPEVLYRVPIGVQGGEWPFRYELVRGPDGAAFVASELDRHIDRETGMVRHQRTPGYGVIEWDPTEGVHAFEVRVTDQAGATTTFEWEVTTGPDAFVFVDSEGGDDGNDGSLDAPLRTFANGLWAGDDEDDRFAGRVAVFRQGTYDVYASAPQTSPVMNWERKPSAFVGFPGESVTFDVSRGHFRSGGRGSHDDLFVANIDFEGARSDLGNNRIFNITGRSSRMSFWELSFDDSTVGTVGTDNPGCIALMSDGLSHENVMVSDSVLHSGAAMQLVVTFDTNHALFERNRAEGVAMQGSNGSLFLRAKDDTSNVTIRDNMFVGSVADRAICVTNQNTVETPPENQEVCWNTVVLLGGDAGISVNHASSTPDGVNSHVYRNTIVSENHAMRFHAAENPSPTVLQGNAYFAESTGVFGSNVVPGVVRDAALARPDFDDDVGLTGRALATHGGIRGAEVMAPADSE